AGQEKAMDDIELDREYWEAYYAYLDYVDHLLTRLEKIRYKIKKKGIVHEEIREYMGMLLRLCLTKALKGANKLYHSAKANPILNWCGMSTVSNAVLKNLWDYVGTKPFSPFTPFFVDDRFLKSLQEKVK